MIDLTYKDGAKTKCRNYWWILQLLTSLTILHNFLLKKLVMCVNDKSKLNPFPCILSSLFKNPETKYKSYNYTPFFGVWSLVSHCKEDLDFSLILSTTIPPQSTTLSYSCSLHWTNLWITAPLALWLALHTSCTGLLNWTVSIRLIILGFQHCVISAIILEAYHGFSSNFELRGMCIHSKPQCLHDYIKMNITELRWIIVDCVQLVNDRVYMKGLVYVSNQPLGYILAGTVHKLDTLVISFSF